MPKVLTWLRQAFTQNLSLKILSLLGALLLFSIVRGAEDARRSVFVDVVAILPPEDSGRILVSELPDRVKLTLQGSRSLLNSIRREEIDPVQVDLSDADLRYYYFEPTSFDIPAGVQIVQLAPASIPLRWADRVQRAVPVRADIRGEPGPGLMIEEPVEVDPPEVVVRGAQTEVEGLSGVTTESVDVRGLGLGRHVRRVRLQTPPPHAAFQSDGMVRVVLDVVPELTERRFEGLAVSPVGPGWAQIRPERVSLVLRGAPPVLESLDPEAVVPWVDVTGEELDAAGTRPVPVQVRGLPEGVSVVEVQPPEALVSTRGRSD